MFAGCILFDEIDILCSEQPFMIVHENNAFKELVPVFIHVEVEANPSSWH